jgi:hypothetical protein
MNKRLKGIDFDEERGRDELGRDDRDDDQPNR